jgi:4-hydroxy-tetrahydrodipicolinate synthase
MTPNFELFISMFNGSIVALVTPFTDPGGIDFQSLDGLVEFHLQNGSNALVVAGTTGESATLTPEEFSEVLARVVKRVNGRLPVVAGTGSASTGSAIGQTIRAADLGADAALVVTPYYNRPTQHGLEAHFTAIADDSPIPVLLYNVPSRTAVDMLPETVERLSRHPRIHGIKEAVASEARIEKLLTLCGPEFTVLSGDDGSCLRSMKAGAQGVISVAANVVPNLMAGLFRAANQQEWTRAEELDARLRPLFDVLMIETNPIPVKWALFEMGLTGSRVRLPLTELSRACRNQLRQCLGELGLAR